MAKKDEEIKPVEDQKIEVVETSNDIPDPTPKKDVTFAQGIAPYLSFLEAMRVTKKHIDTAPTFTPKNFFEQIQFYDDGVNRRIYVYVNGTWRYVALT